MKRWTFLAGNGGSRVGIAVMTRAGGRAVVRVGLLWRPGAEAWGEMGEQRPPPRAGARPTPPQPHL